MHLAPWKSRRPASTWEEGCGHQPLKLIFLAPQGAREAKLSGGAKREQLLWQKGDSREHPRQPPSTQAALPGAHSTVSALLPRASFPGAPLVPPATRPGPQVSTRRCCHSSEVQGLAGGRARSRGRHAVVGGPHQANASRRRRRPGRSSAWGAWPGVPARSCSLSPRPGLCAKPDPAWLLSLTPCAPRGRRLGCSGAGQDAEPGVGVRRAANSGHRGDHMRVPEAAPLARTD